MKLPAVIYGVGLSCPLGRHMRAAFAAAEAGIRRFVEVADIADPAGEPARACRLASLVEDDPFTRALWFARDAVAAALAPMGTSRAGAVPVFVSGPAAALGGDGRRALVAALQGAAPPRVELTWATDSIVSDGRGGGVTALAAGLVALDDAPLVLVGGLDSLAAGEPLRALADANLLLGQRNCDGRLPGEGAAFVLLGRAGALASGEALARVEALARADEPRPFVHARASQGEGLSRVFAALRACRGTRVDEVVMAQGTERYWGTELARAYLRNIELMPEPMRTRQLAQIVGDCGAAAFSAALAWAVGDLLARRVTSAVVYASADHGPVGGVVMSEITGPRSSRC